MPLLPIEAEIDDVSLRELDEQFEPPPTPSRIDPEDAIDEKPSTSPSDPMTPLGDVAFRDEPLRRREGGLLGGGGI